MDSRLGLPMERFAGIWLPRNLFSRFARNRPLFCENRSVHGCSVLPQESGVIVSASTTHAVRKWRFKAACLALDSQANVSRWVWTHTFHMKPITRWFCKEGVVHHGPVRRVSNSFGSSQMEFLVCIAACMMN